MSGPGDAQPDTNKFITRSGPRGKGYSRCLQSTTTLNRIFALA